MTDKWARGRARELTPFQCCVSMMSPSGCTYTLSAIQMDSLRDRIAALAAEAYEAGAKSKLEEANEALRGWLRVTSQEEMIQKARADGREEGATVKLSELERIDREARAEAYEAGLEAAAQMLVDEEFDNADVYAKAIRAMKACPEEEE